ncbi:NAD(P)-dependent oxidoreductase [Pseudomonas sp. TH05]|uniref:NAD-dependent epimerase/dehydratase family protein n=1 Tax=unclassified Pseudomonas TaxID=196821 RepID=UPI0009982914|nr:MULTISPECIES: NAD(P)-dependent oxidoreductase [unclassified Pseudomonas]MBK5543095.1 NAD(P)-dependent oxidoreductase [Pseudomonas sp. TH07]MBK5560527.1 NAD(P)-dependent oxidoreductase [Pseudomonas sp. TH05]OOV96511.1 epimerase [Pseudomonas sp. MF4836]
MNGLNVLLTGACGRIGKTFFQASRERYRFTLTDRIEADFEVAAPHRFLRLDLTDPQAIGSLLEGIDVIVHLAGIPHATASFDELLPNNILATTYLFEAAVAAGCKRVVFASSAQTIEGYPVDRQITPGMPVMPANLYGVSKCYGEALCAFYSAKRGLSCIALRIGAFEFPEHHELTTTRDLSAWLSPRDAVQLLQRSVETPGVQHLIGHGISNNRFKRLDLSETTRVLGYQPQDDAFAEDFGIGISY